jgi:hypothetical protein
MPPRLLLLALAIHCANVSAQNVVAIHMQGQPLIYTESGQAKGCGVRVIGIVGADQPGRTFTSFDVSVNVYASGLAIGKVIGEVNTPAGNAIARSVRQPVFGTWFRAGSLAPVAPINNSFKASSDKGAYLFQAGFSESIDLILSMLKQEELSVAVAWKRDREVIYTGTPLLQENERQRVLACLQEAIK